MKIIARPIIVTFISVGLVFVMLAGASADVRKNVGPVRSLAKTSILEHPWFQANRIGSWISNEGEIVSYHVDSNAGMYWPRQPEEGVGRTINFQSGIWVGGKVDGQIRSAVSEYVSEYTPGPYEADRRESESRAHRVFIITDNDFKGEPGTDFLEWPFELGAPYEMDEDGNPVDADGNIISKTDYDNMVPLLMGAETYWCVFNDRDPNAHQQPFGTPPLGIEVHQMLWGYNRTDAFGDMMFIRYYIINKGGNTIDSTYMSFWADVDLGDSEDDLVATDTSLSLGYHYNDGADINYPIPPAIGYDFFQGPVVPSPGDTAKVSRWWRKEGFIPNAMNLPMTSFAHYVRGGEPYERDPETALEMYRFMMGLDGLGNVKLDADGNPTVFSYTGDPVTGTGWLRDTPADLRMLMTAGPFTLAPGDTQELVGGIVIAQGDNALHSAQRLKQVDEIAQIAYDIDFALPPPPPAPIVTVGSLPNQIVLTWEPNAEDYHAIDKTAPNPVTLEPTYYDFQGYNVYQVNGPVDVTNLGSVKLATYDIVDTVGNIMDVVSVGTDAVELTVQEAENSGIQRYINITEDAFTGERLINFRRHYFIVEAYGYNSIGSPKILRSARNIIVAVPGPPLAGTGLIYDVDQVITEFSRIGTSPNKGIADVSLSAIVIDPNLTQDKTFEITFFTDSTRSDYWWRLEDLMLDSIVIDSQATSTADDDLGELIPDQIQPILYDGLSVTVDGTYRVQPDIWEDSTGYAGLAGNVDPTTDLNFLGTSRTNDAKRTGLLKEFPAVEGGNRPLEFRHDLELRFTQEGSKATRYKGRLDISLGLSDTLVDVPWELWDIEYNNGDGTYGRQINSIWIDNKEDRGSTDGFLGDSLGQIDVIIAAYSPYDGLLHTTKDPADTNGAWMLYFKQDSMAIVDFDTVDVGYSVGDVFRIAFKNHIVSEEDTIQFATRASVTDDDSLREDEISRINVFPNPYFGQNREETNSLERFVTFTHLPPHDVTIRIFTLAGHLVKVIQHDNGTSMERWNLNNISNIPVASGMYIAHIDVKEGSSKILKLAIFAPEERLDLF